jgi:hypothetical protein
MRFAFPTLYYWSLSATETELPQIYEILRAVALSEFLSDSDFILAVAVL